MGRSHFLFVLPQGADGLTFMCETPSLSQIKKKVLLIVKARADVKADFPGENGIAKEIVFMEVNRPILENLYNVCTVSQDSRFVVCREPASIFQRVFSQSVS